MTTEPTTTNASRHNVVLLALCQALFMTGNSAVLTTTALVGLALATDKALATLPLGLTFLVTTATTLPAAFVMKRLGRRAGFLIGACAGASGGALCVYAIFHANFALFTVVSALLGANNSFLQFYHAAASE